MVWIILAFVELCKEKKYTVEEIVYILQINDNRLKKLVEFIRGNYN